MSSGSVPSVDPQTPKRSAATLPDKITPVKKAPKIIETARSRLGRTSFTLDELKGVLSKHEMNALGNTFRQALKPDQKDTYRNLGSDSARNEWMMQFCLDPQGSITTGFNQHTTENGQKNKAVEGWITEAEIAGPEWMNSAAHAKIIVESGEFTARDHEISCLAAAGIKQFYVNKQRLVKWTGWKDTAGVKATQDLKADEYEEVKDSMSNGFGTGTAPKKIAVKKEPKVKTPADKARAEATAAKGLALRKCKKAIDTVTSCISSSKADLQKVITTKGYPQASQQPQCWHLQRCYNM